MNAVSVNLLETIKELQALSSLKDSALGGGTSLALRYNHRESVDIDLFFSEIIGRAGYRKIENEVLQFFKGSIVGLDYPCNIDDQYIFLRFFVRKNGEQIKVEILQNMCFMHKPEVFRDVRVLSQIDMAILKLMAASNRSSFKDIYDLKYLTDSIPLIDIFRQLEEKEKLYQNEKHKTIFALDEEVSPTKNPLLLLKFDPQLGINYERPDHSARHFKIVEGVSWLGAKSNWRRRVRELFDELEIDFPTTI